MRFSTRGFIYLTVIFLLAMLVGCSGDTVSPPGDVSTLNTPSGDDEPASGRYLLAYLHIYPDLENLTFKVEPARESEVHFNVKGFLLPPNCSGCIEFFVHSFNPTTRIINVDVTLKNPTFLVGYDVRGILIANGTGHEIANPDDWTKLFDDSDPLDINPFVAFDIDDPTRKFNFYETDTRNVLFKIPKPPNWGGFDYAVDASWPGHCKEPYEINGFVQGGQLAKLFDEATISVDVHDWQDDVTEVTLDATPFMGEVVDMTNTAGDTWSCTVTNSLLPDPGIYRCLVSAYSPNKPGWWLYDYVDIIVSEPIYQDRITFASNRTGNWDIFMMNPDGTGVEQLTTDESQDDYPDFNRTSRKIAFRSDRDAHPGSPPNEVLSEIYVYDIDTTGVTKISSACETLYPDWSPSTGPIDQGYIVFVTSYLECLPSGETKTLAYVDALSGDIEYLPTGFFTQYRTDPEFSPDGAKVIWAEFAMGKAVIQQMDFPSGDNVTDLTDYGQEFQCTFNPDGTMIAYSSTRNDNTDIYIMEISSGIETRITYDIAPDEYPTFSPDGQRIAFATYRDGDHSEIYITNLTGEYFFNLTDNPDSDDYGPCWSGEIF